MNTQVFTEMTEGNGENWSERIDFEEVSTELSPETFTSVVEDLNVENELSSLLSQGSKQFEDLIEQLLDSTCKTSNSMEFWKDYRERQQESFYTMKSKPLGYCLIINNVEFASLSPRKGSDRDADALENFFKKIGCCVEKVRNMEANEMFKRLENFSKKNFSNVDFSVVIILSHGKMENNLDVILGVKEKTVSKQSILNLFNNKKCKSLIGKPKIFFFMAGRGETKDYGVVAGISPSNDVADVNSPYVLDIIDVIGTKPYNMSEISRHPEFSDVLIVHSTLPGHISLPYEADESYFVQDLVTVLWNGYQEKDLETMVSEASEKTMNKLAEHLHVKQAPHIEKLGPSSKKIRFYFKSSSAIV